MKIAFYPQNCVPYHARSIEERPIGGTETAVIRVAEGLHKRGHDVTVFTVEPNPPASAPQYLHISKAAQMKPVDVFVCLREWIPLVGAIPCRKRFFWTQDAADLVHNWGIGDKRVHNRIDGVVFVSRWQAEGFCRESGLAPERTTVIPNGVYLPYFEGEEARMRKRLIYSSTPYRGLNLLFATFPELKARHPELELHVFSGFEVYQRDGIYNQALERQYEALFAGVRGTPGIFLNGGTIQPKLAREYMKSAILAYPNTFAETFCITALEAQAAGCAIVTSALGALPDTVGEAGVLLSETPGSIEYLRRFVSEVDRLLSDDTHFNELRNRGLRRAESMSWDKIAELWEKYLLQQLN